ncbi:MAG TPA: PAS domain S-box protein [Bryobacteraceae bacterium]|nr:PAS domain S-box protein [Bryobacteraceae bacterium]
MLHRLNPDEAMAHLAAIVESSEDAIISKALDGTILSWNAGAERVYGYAAAEAIGRDMTFLLPENRADEETEILDAIAQGQPVNHFETVRRTKSGDLIDVSLSISPIHDTSRRIVGASHVARDITERKRLDQQLRHLAAIVEFSEDAIISKTLDGIILSWNAGAERVYGYTAAEAIGRPMTFLLPEDRSDEEAAILKAIAGGQPVDHFETVRRTKRGDLIDVSLTISPIHDTSDRIVGASHVARNITERKRLDQQLRHTQKLESLGVLAGGVAHDFNNLLTGILGNASLALETLPSDSRARDILHDVVRASERASHLTRQLLAYSGKGQFIIEPLNLSQQVREISSLIRTSISRNVRLTLELNDDVPIIQADSSQLQQLIMNLVINGAESIGEGDNGTVLVSTGVQDVDEPYLQTIGESALPTGTYVTLEVHDTGCGMDEATLARIFDPFFTTKFTGRGLGLAAVLGIVRGHKGAMKVYSHLGEGTTFKVLFPAAKTNETVATKPIPVDSLPASNELILVIDDEEIIRRTAKSMLEHHGYQVVLAENGNEGVQLFQVLAEKVSAVLLDMAMPVMNGEEALRRLKAINPAIKVILSSGYNQVETIRRFTGEGLAGFIQKPYSTSALVEKIRSVLQGPNV